MSIWSRYGRDTIASSETFIALMPKNNLGLRRPILYVHGVEASDGSIAWRNYAQRLSLFNRIVDSGHPFLSCTHGGNNTWGNDTVIARIDAALDYLMDLPGVETSKVALLATSAGTPGAMAWAAQNLSLVSCIIGIIPVVDITDVHTNNRGSFTSAINTAYGGTYSEATFGAAHNPNTMAAAGTFDDLPIQLWYGNSDTIVAPATLPVFESNAGPNCEIHQMTGGHEESIVSQVSLSSVLSFIADAG